MADDGLPESARARMAASDAAGVFVSDLAVSEFLALRRAGLAPVGQVFGATVLQVTAPTNSGVSGELKILTRVTNDAWKTVLARLTAEARLLGASAVLGIDLKSVKRGESDSGEVWEFTARGAAVRGVGRPAPGGDAPVLLATLHGAELVALQQAGARPVGLALGNCAYYRIADPPPGTPPPSSRPWFGRGSGRNVERTDYTQAVYQARRLAMERLRQDAQAVRATGVVDVKVEVEKHPGAATGLFFDYFCHFFAVGTAVVHSRPTYPDILPTLDLRDSLQPASEPPQVEAKQKNRRRDKR